MRLSGKAHLCERGDKEMPTGEGHPKSPCSLAANRRLRRRVIATVSPSRRNHYIAAA
jgi:hypothetical protein